MTTTTPPRISLIEDDTTADVRATLRRVLDKRGSETALHQFVADEKDHDEAAWTIIAEQLGLTGLLIPSRYGGADGSAREAGAVLTELGRSLTPVPYLASAVIATTALVHCAEAGSTEAARVLPLLAEGAIATLVVPANHAAHDPYRSPITATEAEDGSILLSGNTSRVMAATSARFLVVPAQLNDNTALVLIDSSAPHVTVSHRNSIDRTQPLPDVTFNLALGALLADGPTAQTAITSALGTGAALIASEGVGICEWALATATDYLTVRHQFGRPIGSNQSLRHRAAQMWIDTNHARGAATYAAATLADRTDDAGVATAMAKAYCSATTLKLVEQCLQIHGGIGFTWDHRIHLYLKRAFANTVILGNSESHKQRLAVLIDLPVPGGVSDTAV
jgi:alkylation response protein AidB-like acyl-CoA dehydrogenase